ncbi:hypothetical protein Tsp_15108 [Trichinella spiralis]|uniref:hypothetical protein n=1 Tax=Trichinella spiralis TaxID=6334 RepID=UPI0001EFE0DC|nr:hypothetical protein Tsp_15108 [Trichinella spiralis]
MHTERTRENSYARTLGDVENYCNMFLRSLSRSGGLLLRVDDLFCPILSISGDGDAAAFSSLCVVTTAVSSSGITSTFYLPVIRFSLHCNYVQQSHSVFSPGLCVWATVDRLRSVPGRTVGLSESQLSLVSSTTSGCNQSRTVQSLRFIRSSAGPLPVVVQGGTCWQNKKFARLYSQSCCVVII